MGAAYFYHLTRSPLDRALPMLIERAMAKGWRVAVRTREAARAEWLDQRLWQDHEVGFLPHGLVGGPHDGLQPVLLTTGAVPRGVSCLMTVDGADASVEECAAAERVCIVFDGNDPSAVETARGQWKGLTQAGVPARYWSEESGSWAMKSEVGSHPG